MFEKIFGKLKKLKPIHWTIIFLGLVLYVGAMIGIVNYQSTKEKPALFLELSSPREGDIYFTETTLVQGSTLPKTVVYSGDKSVKSDDDGNFSIEVPLAIGVNSLNIYVTQDIRKVEKAVAVTRKELTMPEETIDQPASSRAGTSSDISEPSDLSSSGPETLFIPEISLLSASLVGWSFSKKRLAKNLRK